MSSDEITQHEPTNIDESQASSRHSHWWFIELWDEKRPIFKEGVWHTAIFAGLLGSLEIAQKILELSTLPPEELRILNRVHFYMYATLLVMFAASFIIKLVILQFVNLRNTQ